jgi:hypothetical protein
MPMHTAQASGARRASGVQGFTIFDGHNQQLNDVSAAIIVEHAVYVHNLRLIMDLMLSAEARLFTLSGGGSRVTRETTDACAMLAHFSRITRWVHN